MKLNRFDQIRQQEQQGRRRRKMADRERVRQQLVRQAVEMGSTPERIENISTFFATAKPMRKIVNSPADTPPV